MILIQIWETGCCHGSCWAGCNLPRQYHCIVLTAFCLHTLSAEVFPARLSRKEAVANGPRLFFHLEWLLLEVIETSTHQELGWGQPRQCVMCGLTLEGNFVMPFSSLYLPKQRFFLSSVESRCSTQLHHYSAASRGFLSGELFLRNLESLQTMWRQISGHSHSEHFKVCHVFEKYPPWLLRRVMHLSSSTRWLRASVSSCLLLRAGGFRWESPIGRRRCQPIELWALFWTWWVRS